MTKVDLEKENKKLKDFIKNTYIDRGRDIKNDKFLRSMNVPIEYNLNINFCGSLICGNPEGLKIELYINGKNVSNRFDIIVEDADTGNEYSCLTSK